MSAGVRTFCSRDHVLMRLTSGDPNNSYFKAQDDDYPSRTARLGRIFQTIILTTAVVVVAGSLIRNTIKAVKPTLLLAIPIGVGLAALAHRFRCTVLADKTRSRPIPYTASLIALYHNTCAVLKGKWQVIEATAAAIFAIALLGIAHRLSRVYPVSVAFFAALSIATVASAFIADYLIGRVVRQI